MTRDEQTGRWPVLADPADLAARLGDVGYLDGDGLAAAAFLALQMRPVPEPSIALGSHRPQIMISPPHTDGRV